ncbi:hypothetical protein PSCICN_33170 [Pseudomonas cichorii]|uniref:hypothetical protein n=1 Tax=Pseudomonas cichorii TaxID=36746 RepID=UPI0019105D88|nr:hypothetical protein [Pseudomonas cichorii]GFM82625.1 hypothetical protein PSCICN_33170 [Pseudomonas cichorii]
MDIYDMSFPGSARQAQAAPEAYESARIAMNAIIAYTHPEGWYDRVPINWVAAEQALFGGDETLEFSNAEYPSLYNSLMEIGYSGNTVRAKVVEYGLARWSTLFETIKSMAVRYVPGLAGCVSYVHFGDVIRDFPALVNDDELFENFINSIQFQDISLEIVLTQLRVLGGNETRAIRVLRAIGAAGHSVAHHQFALLCAEWAGASSYGKLQYALWYDRAKHNRHEPVVDICIPPQVWKLASLLVEFGLGPNAAKNHYNLSYMPGAAIASWRNELAVVVGDDRELAAAALETFFVMGPTGHDHELLSATVKLAERLPKGSLAAHVSNETTLANRRARACLGMIEESDDVLDLMLHTYGGNVEHDVNLKSQLPRTWLGDARIEQLFECSVNEMAKIVGDEIFDNLHAGEETHLSELFKELKFCLGKLSRQLAYAANELDASERFNFSLSQRIIGKPEEGGEGIDHSRFSTDVCLIFKAMDDGVCFSERATLIQAKRLQVNNARAFIYSLKRDQLNDIATQTLASFLLLLGPAYGKSRLPVMPAGLMVDLMKNNSSMLVSPSKAAGLGRSFGTWLLEDVVGLWTGDKADSVIEKALGRENGRPRLIFELIVQRQSKGTDGWTVPVR